MTRQETWTESLFDDATPHPIGPFQAHSDTSRAAAVANYPRSGTQRARVLLELRARFDAGATDHELTEALHLSPSSIRPRRVELVEAGLVEDSGVRRPTETGSLAVVWRCTDAGRVAAWHVLCDGAAS